MASNNNDSGAGGYAIIFGILGAMLIFVAVFLAFVAFLFTIVALIAWNRPLRLGKWVVTPDEARGFVGRGIIGAVAVPAFCGFCQIVFEVPIDWSLLNYMLLGGYTLGSLGLEIMMANDDVPSAPVTVIPPEQQLPPPSRSRALPAPEAAPFRYASWDNEEGR